MGPKFFEPSADGPKCVCAAPCATRGRVAGRPAEKKDVARAGRHVEICTQARLRWPGGVVHKLHSVRPPPTFGPQSCTAQLFTDLVRPTGWGEYGGGSGNHARAQPRLGSPRPCEYFAVAGVARRRGEYGGGGERQSASTMRWHGVARRRGEYGGGGSGSRARARVCHDACHPAADIRPRVREVERGGAVAKRDLQTCQVCQACRHACMSDMSAETCVTCTSRRQIPP